MKIISPLVLIFVLSFTFYVGCTKEKIDIPNVPMEHRLEQFVNNGLDFKLGTTRAEIIKNLGNPKGATVEKTSNIHDPAIIDEVHELFYDGLLIRVFYSPHDNNEFILGITVSKDKYKVLWTLNVGSSKKKVKSVLGEPVTESGNVYHYIYESPESGYQDDVYFYFNDGFVEKIEWSFYID